MSIQTINVVNQNIPLIGLTSLGISLSWMINVRGAMNNWQSKVALTLGGSIGAMSSVPFNHFLKHM